MCPILLESPVSVSKKMRDVRVVEGETVTLTCIMSRTNADIQWLKNNHPVVESETRISQTVSGQSLNLVIQNAQLVDDADYTVTCGEAKCTAHVYVEGKLFQ